MTGSLLSSLAMPIDFPFDWSRVAKLIVHQSLQTQPGERVIIHADPTYFPALIEQVRVEIVKAGAVELFTAMLFPDGLQNVRRSARRREDHRLYSMEDQAMEALFALADIFIWLPTRWAWNVGQTERILKTWPGRSIHFHWIMNPMDSALFHILSKMYGEALYIDYQALSAQQERLIGALQDSAVHITDPAGTDLRFRLDNAHFHRGNGNASKEFISTHARPGSARDREVELPAGAIRTVDVTDTAGILIWSNENFGGRQVGTLTYNFKNNRITRIESEYHNAFVQAMWKLETGDKDFIGEFNLGVNPSLKLIPGQDKLIPYYGYGAGVLRISLGDNQESGGENQSSYHQWLFLTAATATMKANGSVIVDHGGLVTS